jgi:hypothetical protein
MASADRISAKQAARKGTEAALLSAATELLLESPSTDVLRSLRPGDIARRAVPPRTTGAFYNIWPTQAEFRRALLDHVLSLDRSQGDRETVQALADHLSKPELDLAETVRVAANLNFDGFKRDAAFRLQHSLWTRHASDPEVRDGLRNLYIAITGSLEPMYQLFLDRAGRRMRAPYTIGHLGVALAALVEGLHVRWAVQPEAVPDDLGPPPGVEAVEGQEWSTFANLTHLLIMAMTEPVPED